MVLGDPVAQVRAPEVFNSLFGAHGIDAVLVPAHVRPVQLLSFMREVMTAKNVQGFWLTVPHKAAAMPLLDRCDRLGTAAGAVNAVRRNTDGSVEGALLDGIGFVRALDVHGVRVRGARVLVFGAGGAGTAIALSLAERGPSVLAIYDAVRERAEQAVRCVQLSSDTAVRALDGPDVGGFDLVVHCTPMGLDQADPLPFDVDGLAAHASVVDILMKCEPTKLLRACAQRGIAAFPGDHMLLQQVPEYLDFFGYDTLAAQLRKEPAALSSLMHRSPH
jgi:shikimate dehydrogenase